MMEEPLFDFDEDDDKTGGFGDPEHAMPDKEANEYLNYRLKQMRRMMALNSEIRNMFDHTTEGDE